MQQPLIGITTAVQPNERAGVGAKFFVAFERNVKAIERAGGLPILIPCGLETDALRAVYERVDAILLPGGADVDPVAYGAQAHPKTGQVDPVRDKAEIQITRWAAEEERPLFAICRGHQVVNVALGGTLIQDIPELVETELWHDFPPSRRRDHLSHEVSIEPGSLLENIVGTQTLMVNSMHHQALEQVAARLNVTAHAPDGIIEATELAGHRFFHTVQWHPEDITHLAPMQALFNALVNTARERA